jgi:methionyl-tRNA formyltransferase
LRFVYTLDKEVPYGQFMLKILLERDLVPEIVIEEESSQATRHRNIFLERLKDKNLPPSIDSQTKKYGINYAAVPSLNSSECEKILKKEAPDLMVSGGTIRIMKKNIFSIPLWGTLVSHPGVLPYVRGAASPAWSIYKDIQVGCSCIIIDEGIDTGPIIKSKIVPVYFGDTYEDVVERNIFYCGELMAEVVFMFKAKDQPIPGETQNLTIGDTYKVMPPELVEEVKAKLKNGTYRWMQPKNS